MSKSLKKALLIVGIAAAVCAAVWGGLTLARNAQRGDVKVFDVPSFAMTDYWGDTANTSGSVSTDKLQKIYLSQSQTVSQVYVKEGQNVKKGDKLLAYDTTLSQAEVEGALPLEEADLLILNEVEGAQIQLERMQLELETAKNNLSLYRKAENREELQKEYDRVAAILEKLRSQQDQLAGRGSPVKQGRLGDSLGQSKDKPLYYQWLEDTRTKEYYLTDDIIRNDILPKSRNSAYVVLVTRAGNVNNGAITCYGMYIVAEDTETPVKLKVMNDLPAYQDGYVTPTTAEIKDREEQLATIEKLLNESLTKEELKSLIATTEKQVYDGQRSVKQAQIGLDKKKKELGDGTVYSEIDGVVKAVRPADEAYNNSEAVVEVSGGGGYYITGALGELDLGKVKLGDTVDISSWMTGASCQGEIVEISDYPTDNANSWSDGNSNVSYYPFKVFVSEEADLREGDYVDMSYQNSTGSADGNTLYLESMFIRTENGKSYVMVRDDNGKLEKRWVQTGRNLWGSYTQIRGGLTVDDFVAFPYGRSVVEGAGTTESTRDKFYSGM